MKKSLLALAVLSAFAGAASAQSNVTIYGIVDAGVVREFGTPVGTPAAAGSAWKLVGGGESGSRLGFKGSEDLGGGLSANFALENGFNVDNGTLGQGGLLFGRQAFVGLSAKSWGAINFGRQYAPIFLSLDSIDPFGTGLAGASYNLMGTAVRMNNTIKYSTPNLGGFSADLAYGFGEVAGNTSASRQIGFSANYAAGPVAVTLAYHNTNNATNTNQTKLTLLGGAYNFGVAKAYLAFETEKDDAALDQRDWLVGVTVPVGAGSLMASYIRKDDRAAASRDANQIALGYNYSLSKRTDLYTSVARIDNKNGASYTVGNATESGTTDKAFNVGVRHRF
ncbi:porin [Herbaspirillum sp. HC18]|nr:porin [Herbaspirillum sp. HC18]